MGENGVSSNNAIPTTNPCLKKENKDTEEILNIKIKSTGSVGQILAYSNFIWATFQMFLLALNYFLDNSIDFGQIPGVTVILGLANPLNETMRGHRMMQMVVPFTFYQTTQILLSDVFLNGISEICVRKLDWFIMAYGLTFFVEVIFTVYCLAMIHTEFLFFFGTIAFIIIKVYTIYIARSLQNLFVALCRLKCRRIKIITSEPRPVVDLQVNNG